MEQCNTNLGPYRATKLWNEVVRAFRNGIPLKRHRRHVRYFENCFTAIEAVDWLHSYMKNNPNFGENVTRDQSLQLLRKFVTNGIFEEVRGCKFLNAEEFKDNGDLYRFVKKSPMKLTQSPKSFRGNTANQFNIENNQNDLSIKKEEKFKDIPLKPRTLSIDEIEFVWKNVILNKLKDKLALPNLDVILDTKCVNPKILIHNATKVNKNGIVSIIDKNEDLPHWVLSAMKCLSNWPIARGSGSCLPNYPGFEFDVFAVVRDYFINLSTPLIPLELCDVFLNVFLRAEYLDTELKSPTSSANDLTFNNFSPAQVSTFPTLDVLCKEIDSKTNLHERTETPSNLPTDLIIGIKLPPNLYFETAFTSTEPITRILPHKETSVPFYLHEPKIEQQISTRDVTSLTKNPLRAVNGGYDNLAFLEQNHRVPFDRVESLSSYHTAPNDANKDGKIASSSATTSSYHTALDCALNENLETDSSGDKWISKRRAIQEWVQKAFWPDFFSVSGRKNAVEIFQLLTLFLRPSDRRKVHLLLIFMNSVGKNPHLKLINTHMIIRTFKRSIFNYPKGDDDAGESLVLRLINFLVESSDQIFKIPHELLKDVQNSLEYQMTMIVHEKVKFSYCEQVSLAEYEKQRENHSRKALEELFDNILYNNNFSEKDRKKKLRKFKESYPDIYSKKTKAGIGKSKKKSTLLDRMKSLRI